MTKTIIYLGIVATVVNLLFGWILSAYGGVNLGASTGVIVLTTALWIAVAQWLPLKAGFRVSLSTIVPALGALQFLLAVLMPNRVEDNVCLILIILLLALEAVAVLAAHGVSQKIR